MTTVRTPKPQPVAKKAMPDYAPTFIRKLSKKLVTAPRKISPKAR